MGLAYPCGATPSLNPAHVALSGGVPLFSAVSLLTGGSILPLYAQGGTQTLTNLTSKIFGIIGPASVNSGTASSDALTFTNKPITTSLTNTMAIIVQFSSVPANTFQGLLGNGGAGAIGISLFLRGSVGSALAFGPIGIGTSPNAMFVPVAGVPYFIAASASFAASNGPTNFIAINLNTGQISTTSVLGNTGTPITPDGSYTIGNLQNNKTLPLLGGIAAVMHSTAFLSAPQLLQWASDPWSFWYPGKDN